MKYYPEKAKKVTAKQALRAAMRLRRALDKHHLKTKKLNIGNY